MTIQHLQYIIEVNRTGSFSQAAQNLYMAQSSVRNAVNALESELGFQLFTRGWHGVVPTEQGAQVLEYAKHMVELHQLMLGAEKPERRDIVIDTSFYVPFDDAFRQLVDENRHRNDISFIQGFNANRTKSEKRLSNFDSDLLVGARLHINIRPINLENKDPHLKSTLHRSLPLVVRIGPGHPLYHKEDLKPEDLNGYPIIDTPELVIANSDLFRTYIDIDRNRTVRSSQRDTRYAMISQGLGYNIGPLLPERINLQYGFRSIPLEGLVSLIYSTVNTAYPLKPEVRRYLELMEENLPKP